MENLILNSHESLKKLKNNILWLRFRVPQSVAILLNLTLMMKMVYINLFIPFLALTLTSRLTLIFNASSWEIEMDSKISLHFFGDIEKAYLNKNLNKDFSKTYKGYQVILA